MLVPECPSHMDTGGISCVLAAAYEANEWRRALCGKDVYKRQVYMELDTELLDRIEKAVSLYSRHQNDPCLLYTSRCV